MPDFISNFLKSFQGLTNWVLPDIFKVVIIIFLSYALKNLLDISSDKLFEKTGNRRLLTIKQISHSVSGAIIGTIALIMILHQLGFDTTPLLAGASLLGVAFGLGLQHTAKDLISGFFILFEDQFVVGDIVNIDNVTGKVEKVTLRCTFIKDLEGNLHIISNGMIEKITVLKDKKG